MLLLIIFLIAFIYIISCNNIYNIKKINIIY